MSNAILSVPLPSEIKEEMDKHKEMKWVEVARRAILERLELLEKMDQLLAKSEFTEEDAIRHGRKIKKKMFTHYRAAV